jgi:YidC/Oxa1 family membrane protein insertase
LDKRLPLALFLSFLVLLTWQLLFAPEPPPRQPAPPGPALSEGASEEAPSGVETRAPAPDQPEGPAIGPLVGESEERTLELSIGTPGQPGSYRARFSNRGARLLELRLGDYYDKVGLSAEEKADREHWVRLVESVRAPGGPTGSLELRAWTSARPYERTPLEQALWSMRELAPQEDPDGLGRPGVVFELAQGTGVRFEKRVLFEPDSYHLHVQLTLENTGDEGADRALAFFFTPAAVVPQESGDKYYVEPQAVYAGQTLESYKDGDRPRFEARLRDDKGQPPKGQFDVPSEVTRFAGVHNKYFAVLMRAADEAALGTLRGAEWRRVRDLAWAEDNPAEAERAWRYMATDVLLELRLPPPGEERSWDYVVFAGPKDRELLASDDPAHEVLVDKDLGFFDGIARALLAVLGLFEGLIGNWGVAIILLTLSVRVLLFPVNRRSQTAMARYSAKMKRLQPQINELKKRYESDPQKLRAAQAELMQKEGAFPPLGGCLPVFVQLPIFFGLYQALRTSFDLRQAPFFGWMTDLSQPDRLLRLDLHTGLPIIGTIEYLNILPPLMVVLWVLQQMTMPKPADEQAARMQRMMLFMPVVMGVFLYNYAAGLSLYMITQSSLGIFEQHVIKRLWPVDDTEPVKRKKPGGFMGRMMERAQEAQRQAEARNRAYRGGGKGGKGGKGGRRR